MASTIAAITTGIGGIVTTADATGNLSLLSGTSTVVAVTSAGAAVTGTMSVSGATTLTGGLNTPLAVTSGGTGLGTLTANNVILGAGTSNPTFVAPSTTGNLLTSNGTTWTSAAAPASGVTTFNGSTTGLTPATATSGAITLGGTLAVANGGTGVTTSTGSGANVLGTSPTLTTPVINGFTGNTSVINIGSGQVYKDASGNVGINTSSPIAKLHVVQTFGNSFAASLNVAAGGTAQSQLAGMYFSPTFVGTGDNGTRRAADIWAGFNGAAWTTQYLAFGVGNAVNDVGDATPERMRIDSSGNVLLGTTTTPSGISNSLTFSDNTFQKSANITVGSISEYNANTSLPTTVFGTLITSNTASATTLTLPSLSGQSGKVISISNINVGPVTVVTGASNGYMFGMGLNGGNTIYVPAYSSIQLSTDGGNWKALTSNTVSATTGAAPYYGARAWVNFNGTGTVAIRASGNVSSITDNGSGDYTVNFTTAMVDANYAVICGPIDWRTLGAADATTVYMNTTFVRLINRLPNNATQVDNDLMSVAIFR